MTVRIGLIGAGGISGGPVEAIGKIEQAKLVAVCDIDRGRAEIRAKAAGTQVFTDYREMLDKVPLDALWLCTTPNVRAEPIEAAIDKRVPVFTENPSPITSPWPGPSAEKIERAKLPVMVGLSSDTLLVTDRLKEYLQKDKINLVSSYYCCPMSLNYRDTGQVTKSFSIKRFPVGQSMTRPPIFSTCSAT